MRSPKFRRIPFGRDGVFDHGGASAPRITVPHILPSALSTASASARLCLSRLNSPPHTIAVYASRWSSPATPQHSLPSARYGLLGPDLHRLERASFLALGQFTDGLHSTNSLSLANCPRRAEDSGRPGAAILYLPEIKALSH